MIRARHDPSGPLALLTALALLLPSGALAASLSGRVIDGAGAPLVDMEVRAWTRADGFKGFQLDRRVRTDGDGRWTMDALPAGDWRVDARMPPGFEGNYGDRWYDVEAPDGQGWVAEDADIITLAADDVRAAIDITLLLVGGLNGRVLVDGEPRPGILVRAQGLHDCRYHHNDETQPLSDEAGDAHYGRFYMRGLRPVAYRLVAYDPTGVLSTFVVPGPLPVAEGQNVDGPDMAMAAAPLDPYEPNNHPLDEGAGGIDANLLNARPPQPWISEGARIGPRNAGDVDWYCIAAEAEDRFLVDVSTRFYPESPCAHHPWVDPVLSVWRQGDDGENHVLLQSDDDSGSGRYGSSLDTGELGRAGRYCAVVTTYGDGGWIGQGQQSAGEYAIRVRMGNRRPHIIARINDEPAPRLVTMREGEALCIDLEWWDPDGGEPDLIRDHTDASGERAREGVIDQEPGLARYCWTADQRAAELSPYDAQFLVFDGEFSDKVSTSIVVESVNIPPSVPEPISPEDGAVLDEGDVELIVANSADGDGDDLKYEFRITVSGPNGSTTSGQNLPEDPDGFTSWAPEPLHDDQTACWQARAIDGQPGGFSAWSDPTCFRVDIVNTPPPTPTIVKPSSGETVLVRQPTLSASEVVDPEGDSIHLAFEVSADPAFDEALAGRVRQLAFSSTTTWTVPEALQWGRQHHARVRAEDGRGQVSPWSEIVRFLIKENQPPGSPVFTGDWPPAVGCEGLVVTGDLPATIRVATVGDPEQEAVVIRLQVVNAEARPGARPITDLAVPQGDGFTEVPFDSSMLEENGHYIVRVRSEDGTDSSAWRECDLWINQENGLPSAIEILSPLKGDVVSPAPEGVWLTVTNPTDADVVIPGSTLELAWCASEDSAFGDCPVLPAEWSRAAVAVTERSSQFPIEGLERGSTYHVRVCGLDETGACGPEDTTWFGIHKKDPRLIEPTGDSCSCRVGRSSRPGGAFTWLGLLALLALRRGRWGRRAS